VARGSTKEERLEHALGLGFQYLNRQDRTVGEVRGHLERHAIDGATVEEAVRMLAEQGYLDDERFARLYAADKRELEQWGADRIRRGLLAREIDAELIDAALPAPGGESELDRALALLARRFPTPPRERSERDRALGVLLRKGYDSELALDALRAYARKLDDQAA
jgi:regulatory protein